MVRRSLVQESAFLVRLVFSNRGVYNVYDGWITAPRSVSGIALYNIRLYDISKLYSLVKNTFFPYSDKYKRYDILISEILSVNRVWFLNNITRKELYRL